MKPKQLLITIAAALCMMTQTAMAQEVNNGKAIQLGTGGITSYWSTHSYDYVYYGNWDVENSKATPGPIKWRVLDTKTNMENATEGDGLFLLSEELLGTGDDGGVDRGGGSWHGSGRQAWCKNFYSSSLTIQEQSAVLATIKTDAEFAFDNIKQGYTRFPASEKNILNGDKVFFLSAQEAGTKSYGFRQTALDSENPWLTYPRLVGYYGGNAAYWWLRSHNLSIVGFVDRNGCVKDVALNNLAARPAMNIDSNSVLFTSAAVGGKSTDGMDSGLTAVDDYDGIEWKLTLFDSNRDFSISNVKIDGNAVTFSYSNAQTGTNEYISALIDNNGAITHYGRILQLDGETNAASGTASLTLPVGVTLSESAKLYVFNEQYNGDKMTDYAGYLLEISNPEDDKSAPTLLSSSASRNSEASATVKFVSSEEGTYYYQVVESGAAAPTVEDLTGSKGFPCHGGGTNIINLSELSDDSPKDLYIIIKDVADNVSQAFKIEIPVKATISAEPAILDFGCLAEGYLYNVGHNVTISNIGSQSVIVNLPASEDFDISEEGEGFKSWDSTVTIAPGATAVFSVHPKMGLAVGNYNETLTISGSNGASASVSLTFAVLAHSHTLEYRYNATSHWQECSDHQCPFEDKGKTSPEAHVYEEGQDICSICGYYAPYTLTIENGGIGSTGVGNYGEGSDVPIFAGRRAGYRFYCWVSFNGGSFADAYSEITTFTMPAAGATITAVWQADTDTDTGKAIQSGADVIAGYWVNDSYDYIYYGNWEAPDEYTTSGPIKWRVLDTYTNTFEDGLFLLSDVLYGYRENGGLYFQQNTHIYSMYVHKGDLPSDGDHTNCKPANAWQGSDAQAWCNSFYTTCLTTQEQGAVLATTKSDNEYTFSIDTYVHHFAASENILNSENVFFLSAEEARTEAYGFGSNADRMANYGSSEATWWLRSPYGLYTKNNAGVVSESGSVLSPLVNASNYAARPAFNLDLNSVLFTSAATSANGGKADAAVDGNLTAVKNYSGNEWKLTVSDSNRSGFAISDAMKSDDGTIVFSYSNAQTGENEYISAIIESNGAFTYYGRILQLDGTQNGSSGIASLTLPSGVTLSGNSKLYIFNEQYNGDYQTDYSSPLIDLSSFANISYSGTCGAEGDGSNVKWVLSDDGTLIIYGTGAMADYALLRPSPWCNYVSSIKKAVIEEGITNLGNYMFYCGIENGNVHCELTSIEIPSSVTRIGNYALVNCSKLANITLPDDLKSIGNVAFGGCQSLTSIDIPSGITTIGEQTFSYCVGLKSINIPSGVTTIDKHAFQGCSSLTSMTVYANTPPALGENVFEDANADLIAYVPYSLVSDYETKWGTNPIEIQGLRATVTAAPSAITGLIDNGQAQALVTEGTAENGTMVYALEDGVYSENIPTGTDAGEYNVYYKAKGDGITYGDSDEAYVTVSIKAAATAIAETQEITVYALDGRIYVDAEEYAIYNLIGQNVTTLNGSLHGLYVVVVEGSVVKIRVN